MLNLGSTKQRAVKRHFCSNCCGSIQPGQVYVRARIVDGGEAWVWKSHEDCQEVSEILYRAGIEGDDGCLFSVSEMDGEMWDIVRRVRPDIAARMRPQAVPA